MGSLSAQADAKGLELAYHIPSSVPDKLIGDPGRLRQILINLIGNAVKFTNKGEVVLRIEVKSETENLADLHFVVSDTGIGILPDKRETIFQAFEQVESSSTRRYGGTGLGLAIVSQLVGMMDGQIWIESEPGQGSRFHFTAGFGITEDAQLAPVCVSPASLRDARVLVVDDNATNRRILEDILLDWNMVPACVENGKAALDALEAALKEEKPFPLALVDYMMPGMDGFQLSELVKQNPDLAGTKIIMLTSAGQRGDAARCLKVGIKGYLLKPVKQSDLLNAVSIALSDECAIEEIPTLTTRHTMRASTRELKILLAEDNLVNQKLASRLLQKMGHLVTVAGTGRDALALANTQRFDLILMDVQMPEMDGLEVTHALRDQEKGAERRVPVIAMTAYAMKGDKEKCLEAGMDGYVSKPINSQELYDCIEAVMRTPGGKPTGAPVQESTPQALDRKGVLDRVGGDADLLREVVDLFLNGCPGLLAEIREACREADPERLERAAHALKGSVGNFGAEAAIQEALKLEDLGRRGELTEAAQALVLLEQEMDRVCEHLEALRKELEC